MTDYLVDRVPFSEHPRAPTPQGVAERRFLKPRKPVSMWLQKRWLSLCYHRVIGELPKTMKGKLRMKKMIQTMSLALGISVVLPALAYAGFAWGTGQNGSTNCYPTDNYGNVLPGVQPAPVNYCYASYRWGTGQDGAGHCYPVDQYGNLPGGVQPVDNGYCTARYAWGTGQDGQTHCYPADAAGNIPGGVQPVADNMCYSPAPGPAQPQPGRPAPYPGPGRPHHPQPHPQPGRPAPYPGPRH